MLKPMGISDQRPVVVKVAVPFVSPRKLAEMWVAYLPDQQILDSMRYEDSIRSYMIKQSVDKEIERTEVSIRGYISSGNIPSFHIGKRLVVNLISHALLDAASQPYPLQVQFELLYPSLPVESFATYTGFEPGVVQGWIKNGYLPNTGLGKHRLVTLPELLLRCETWTPNQWGALVHKTAPKSQPVEA